MRAPPKFPWRGLRHWGRCNASHRGRCTASRLQISITKSTPSGEMHRKLAPIFHGYDHAIGVDGIQSRSNLCDSNDESGASVKCKTFKRMQRKSPSPKFPERSPKPHGKAGIRRRWSSIHPSPEVVAPPPARSMHGRRFDAEHIVRQ